MSKHNSQICCLWVYWSAVALSSWVRIQFILPCYASKQSHRVTKYLKISWGWAGQKA